MSMSKTVLAKSVKDARIALNSMKSIRYNLYKIEGFRDDEVTTLLVSMGQTTAVLEDFQDRLVAISNAVSQTTS